ncbi:MAG: serine protease [Proteobacteria bacterium]|nr:serine protease [Pseudomonadota bacterium]
MCFFRVICLLFLLQGIPCGQSKDLSAEVSSKKSPFPAFAASVVRIEVADQNPDYRSPWNAGRVSGGIGSGFILEIPGRGKRIVTNAHVVSNARFITVTREGVNHPFRARAEFIGHDCDLAMIAVEDPAFFQGTRPLALGGVPPLESAVSVYGYPLGGERISVTRGIVSRIDSELYTHSGVDSHLAIQIDAAINPGNSGGPVLQDGKVVGVAFQGYSGDVAQNVGFMIPSPVIKRFLQDLSKGSYTGYTDLAVGIAPLMSPTARKALGVPFENAGVLVTDVHEKGSANGFLRKDDVLLAIDGHPVACDGRVDLDGESVDMTEVVERKFDGDKVHFDVLRDGKRIVVEFPLQGTWPFRMQSKAYDAAPRYLLHGGLLFQPLDRNLVEVIGNGDLRVSRTFDEFVERHLYLKRPEYVVLSRILPDPVNADCDGLRTGIVDTINGVTIRSLGDVAAAFAQPAKHDVIMLEGIGLPIVLRRADVLSANPRIMKNYGIASERNL